MNQNALSDFVQAKAAEFGVPGVAVGILADGRETFACHGVTSLANPLPVTPDTLFLMASVTKTYTATALMTLVEAGKVELDAPVRRYVPELELAAEGLADEITVLHLLNHTSGLDWGVIVDTGEGDDALAGYVRAMAGLKVIGRPGERASYSQAGYNLVGRIIENVTGRTFEQAVTELVFEPHGLDDSLFLPQDVLARRFAMGHNREQDGSLSQARMWRGTRGNNPGGGLSSSISDQLRWARFHLGDDSLVKRMREPTAELVGSTLGDAFGICWFLRDVDGVRTVGHGGSSDGQFAELLLVPERDFAIAVACNAGPDGLALNQAIVRWALEHCLNVVDADPEPVPHDPERTRELAGRYENDAMTMLIEVTGTGMALDVRIRPEIRANAETEMPPDHDPFPLGMLPGDGDEYIITGGALKGHRGFFTRDTTGKVTGCDIGGRLFTRTTDQ